MRIEGGRVNFHCLAQECPTPCCGPFEGLNRSLAPCFVTSFSYLYLDPADVERLMGGGRADLVVHDGTGFRLKLREDKSCAAFENGLCSIHALRPAVCRAFPFDFDLFGGLVMISKCPGVDKGWSEPGEFAESIRSLRQVYEHWIRVTQERVADELSGASGGPELSPEDESNPA